MVGTRDGRYGSSFAVKNNNCSFSFFSPDELGKLYRKFEYDYQNVIQRVARSAVLNEGQQFTIIDYRSERAKIYRILQIKLKQIFKDNHLTFLNLFVSSINFGKQINELNLKRVLNDIYNEKAKYTKQIALIWAQTDVLVNDFKNQARFILANATYSSVNIVKSSTIDYSYKMEIIHADQLNESLNELNFRNTSSKAVLKQRLSYVYFYSLINHKNLNVFSQDLIQKKVLTSNF
jgi:hypothetical protein